MRILYSILGLLTIAFVAVQFIRPERTNPSASIDQHLKSRIHMPDDIAQLLDRACRDCHSNDTQWPWYSHVAPISWFVIDHVNHGRSHLNFSEWTQYNAVETGELLDEMCREVKKEKMPLPSYLIMHGEAHLTDTDITTLCRWTTTARRSLSRAYGKR